MLVLIIQSGPEMVTIQEIDCGLKLNVVCFYISTLIVQQSFLSVITHNNESVAGILTMAGNKYIL